MNQKISISVAAALDTSSVQQAVNAMGQRIAQANRVQYQPVTTKTVEDVKKLNAALNEVVKTQSGLRQRLKATGQESTPFTDWDWSRMYPHAASRGAAMQGVFERVVGGGRFTAPPQQPQHPPGGGGPGGGGFGGIAAGVVQAGLRAAGPAGGVAAGAVGTGISSGFGAGLMGLVGGIAALGVGKVVGSVMEKLDQAERNNVELDKLKRSLGDVAVSFGTLKGVVHSSADNLKITYEEAGRLSTQFTKLANLSGDQYKTLGDELGTGVGLSRSLGLDPAAGVGLLGQMRGLGITSNTQESRRFALLIGETIGKSNAFAKAEEVFEAIGGYAGSQTRNSMGAANVAGYAGMFSSMVGSGIPGLDPTGAAGLLSKINSTLAAGGAKGEASQFFSGIVGHRMGLDPLQTQILREGGAFATNDEAFGKGSIASRFGISGPGGSKTFLQGSLDELRAQYGNNKGLLAQATANHLGVGMRQAMALLSVDPNQMGEMQQYAGDLTKISGSGITNLSKALYGSAGDRRSLADSYLARRGDDAISKEDRASLESATSDSDLKKALAGMAAKYDQERTTGSDIRDSKNALDNIKTNLADKLVPVAQEMRHGIILLAGGGKKSPQEIIKEVMDLEHKDRINNIKGQFGAKTDPLNERLDHLRNKERSLDPTALAHTYRDKPEILDAKLKERAEVQREIVEIEGKLKKLSEDKARALEEETKALNERLRAMKTGGEGDITVAAAQQAAGGRIPGVAPGGGAGRGGGYDPLRTDAPLPGDLDQKLAEAERSTGLPAGVLKSVIQQETGGNKAYLDDPGKYHYPMGPDGRRRTRAGTVSSAFGPFGILADSTAKDPGYGVAPLKDRGIDEQIRFASEYLAARSKRAGGIAGGLSGYGEGDKYSRQVLSRIGTPAASVGMADESRYKPGAVTSAPLAPLTGEANVTVDLSPDAKRLLAAPSANMSMRFGPATPLGLKGPASMRQ